MLINTGLMTRGHLPYPNTALNNHLVYNGLDSCLTFEVHEALVKELDSASSLIYNFELAMMGPAMAMMQRGIKVDMTLRAEMIGDLEREQSFLESRLNRLAHACWGADLNARSPAQLKKFFGSVLRIPIPIKKVKGEEKESLDRKVLEGLRVYHFARPFVSHILAIRDRSKSLGVLRSGVRNGRIHTSYNVASTETGRWSSSEDAFGAGTNLQNVTERLRRILVADPGMKLGYIDLEQAESRAVAALVYELTGDTKYLDACESGDLHTAVAMLTWPEMKWSADLKENKALADDATRPFYRDFTYRDIAKRLGHGSNYRGSPFGMAQIIPVEAKIIEAFQSKYFTAFPLREWHTAIAREIQLSGILTTPLGRRRQFFGRRTDDSTIREGIAYKPQSMVGDLLNLGMYRVWRHFAGSPVQLLAQIHDAILIQYPEHLEAEIMSQAQGKLLVPFTIAGREILIPCDAKTGWNFAKSDKKLFTDGNPDGLKSYTGRDDRTRSPQTSLLDRRIR